MNIEFLKVQAERCRRLAQSTDVFTEKRLLKLAREYDARIAELELSFRSSPASQSFRSAP
jgi:hypothetical protein